MSPRPVRRTRFPLRRRIALRGQKRGISAGWASSPHITAPSLGSKDFVDLVPEEFTQNTLPSLFCQKVADRGIEDLQSAGRSARVTAPAIDPLLGKAGGQGSSSHYDEGRCVASQRGWDFHYFRAGETPQRIVC